jgi:D-sedoheptulose 7-phosphate isomerase
MSLFEKFLAEHQALFTKLSCLETELESVASHAAELLKKNRTIFFCGNGGSAGDAQHIAAELVGRFVENRRALRAIALTTDTSALTCIANDFGYEHIFARQLEGLANSGDMVFLITTSGNSENLIFAAKQARAMGVTTVGLLGKGGGKLAVLVDVALIVPDSDTARTQEAHIFLGHTLCAQIEAKLGLGTWQAT